MTQQRTPTGQPVILSKLFRRLCLPSYPAFIRSLSGLRPPSVQLGKGNVLPQTKSSLRGWLSQGAGQAGDHGLAPRDEVVHLDGC